MKKVVVFILTCCPFLIPSLVQAQGINACLASLVLTQDDNTTIGELREQCNEQSSVDNAAPRVLVSSSNASEAELIFNRGGEGSFNPFKGYKKNYVSLGRMQNSNGGTPFSGDEVDIKFQFSIQYQIFQSTNNGRLKFLAPLHFGYSQIAWWNVGANSAPFAELNYNPELFWVFADRTWEGIQINNTLGFEHQSNGRDGMQSRSWDRAYWKGGLSFADDAFTVDLKLWDIINVGETNDDIKDYLGNAQLSLGANLGNRFGIEITTTKGREHSKYNTQVDFIFKPAVDFNPRLFLTYYNGYSEALISYNIKTESLRLGFEFPIGQVEK